MDEEATAAGRKRIRAITTNSRAKDTRTTYKSYLNNIHEWYYINRPEHCNDNGEMNFDLIRELCSQSLDDLYDQGTTFNLYLNARTHIRKVFPNPNGVGTFTTYLNSITPTLLAGWLECVCMCRCV